MIILSSLMVFVGQELGTGSAVWSGSGFLMWLQSDSGWSWKQWGLEKLRAGWVPLTSPCRLEASPCSFSHRSVWAFSDGSYVERGSVTCLVP